MLVPFAFRSSHKRLPRCFANFGKRALVILPRLLLVVLLLWLLVVVALWRRRRIAGGSVVLLLILPLLVGLRVIERAVHATRRRIALIARTAVGRIDVAVIRPLLHLTAGILAAGVELRLRRELDRLAGSGVLLLIRLRGRFALGHGGIGATRVAHVKCPYGLDPGR